MPLNASTLRPGYLVSLKTSISGNVTYATRTIEQDHVTDEGARQAKWETERTIADAKEHERATEARSKARHAITRICAASAFGLLCPLDKAAELEAAVAEARGIAEAFNATAQFSQLSVFVMSGKVEQNDVEAVRAINSEIRDLMAEMQAGIAKMDVKAIRDAAAKAKGLGQMLTPDASAKVAQAVDSPAPPPPASTERGGWPSRRSRRSSSSRSRPCARRSSISTRSRRFRRRRGKGARSTSSRRRRSSRRRSSKRPGTPSISTRRLAASPARSSRRSSRRPRRSSSTTSAPEAIGLTFSPCPSPF
jgi:hypothetical protein